MSIRSRMWEKHEVNMSPVVRGVLSVAATTHGLGRGCLAGATCRSTGARAGPGSRP